MLVYVSKYQWFTQQVIFYDKTLWTPSVVKILTYDRGKLKLLNMKTYVNKFYFMSKTVDRKQALLHNKHIDESTESTNG